MLAALALFVLPLLTMYIAIQIQPDLSSALYRPGAAGRHGGHVRPERSAARAGRDDGTDVEMFGFYIWNNISIGFRVFASGMLVGLGPILSLGREGIRAGAVASHLQAVGHGDPFWRFVCGHAAFELTAIVIAGGAGLRLGLNLIAPGQRRPHRCAGRSRPSRCAAVRRRAGDAVRSPPSSRRSGRRSGGCRRWIKYSVAAALWSSVFVWLLAAGATRCTRRRADERAHDTDLGT
jgi:uncharacterized membrane protein SpoIIM required for sporulation